MSRKIEVQGDFYDEEVIAFVRKLKKPSRRVETDNGGFTPSSYYLLQLKIGYSLDGRGVHSKIFLGKEEGEKVMQQLRAQLEPASKPGDACVKP